MFLISFISTFGFAGKSASGLIQIKHREIWFEFRLVHNHLFPSLPCCPVHRMALRHAHAVQYTAWPYDLSILSSTEDGLMICPCCPVQRMALWHVHALQYTEWPYDLSMLFSTQNGLKTCPCCLVHSRALGRSKTLVTIYEKEMPLLQSLTMIPQTLDYQVFFVLFSFLVVENVSTNGCVWEGRRLLRGPQRMESWTTSGLLNWQQ